MNTTNNELDKPTGREPDHAHEGDVLVWCETCQHDHIPGIPAVTWECRDCGWGQWSEADAAAHIRTQPLHRPYRVGHWIPSRIREVNDRAKKAEARLAAVEALIELDGGVFLSKDTKIKRVQEDRRRDLGAIVTTSMVTVADVRAALSSPEAVSDRG